MDDSDSLLGGQDAKCPPIDALSSPDAIPSFRFSRVLFSDAVEFLFDSTWPLVRDRQLDFSDLRRAWKYYLEREYRQRTEMYGDKTHARLIPAYRVRHDLVMLKEWIGDTEDAEIADAMDQLLANDRRLVPLHRPPLHEEEETRVFSDLLKQARRMLDAILYGEQIDEDIVDLRIGELWDMFGRLPAKDRKRLRGAMEDLGARLSDAKAVMHGDLEPLDSPASTGSYLSEDRNKVGSDAWAKWFDMFQFVAGHREGQAGYDPQNERVASRFKDMGWRWKDGQGIECDPRLAVENPSEVSRRIVEHDDEMPRGEDDLKGIADLYDAFLGAD